MSSSSEEEVVLSRVASTKAKETKTRTRQSTVTKASAVGQPTTTKKKATKEKTATKSKVASSRSTGRKKKLTNTEGVDRVTESETEETLEAKSAPERSGSTVKQQRKAPTTIDTATVPKKRFPVVAVIVGMMVVGISGVGIWLGMSDPGQIDVETLVQRHNERVARGEAEGAQAGSVTLPVQRPSLRPSAVQPSQTTTPTDDEDSVSTTTESLDDSDTEADATESSVVEENTTPLIPEDTETETEAPLDTTITENDTSYAPVRHLAQRQPFGFI